MRYNEGEWKTFRVACCGGGEIILRATIVLICVCVFVVLLPVVG